LATADLSSSTVRMIGACLVTFLLSPPGFYRQR
jgi:hypothetical protein